MAPGDKQGAELQGVSCVALAGVLLSGSGQGLDFRWAQSCHVTVSMNIPQVVLLASLAGALGECLC